MTNQTRTEPLDRLAEWLDAYNALSESSASSVLDEVAYDRLADASTALRNAAPSLIAEAREAARLRTALEQDLDRLAAMRWDDSQAPEGERIAEGVRFAVGYVRAALVKP